MNSEVKNFIKGIEGLTSAEQTFLNENLMSLAVYNISKTKGKINFSILLDFFNPEKIEIDENDNRIFEMFISFKTSKNAINCLQFIAEGGKLTDKMFENENKITPKKEIKDFSFMGFYNSLTPTEKNTLKTSIDAWYSEKLMHDLPNIFYDLYINSENQINKGDILMMANGNRSWYGKVFSTSPNGWVTIIDQNSWYTMQECRFKKVAPETLNKEEAKKINDFEAKITEEAELLKISYLEKSMKRAKRIAEETAKAEAKAEKLAKKEAETKAKAEARDKAYNELIALKLDSPEAIKTAVEKLNSAGLDKEKIAEVRAKMKKAKDDLKAKAEAQKTKAEAPKETKATANAKKPTSDKPKAKDIQAEALKEMHTDKNLKYTDAIRKAKTKA